MLKSNFFLLFVVLVFSSQVFSAAYFTALSGKYDHNCPRWNLDRFTQVEDWITVGVDGAQSYGYDFEVPISRRGVDVIWCAIQPKRGKGIAICQGQINYSGSRAFSQYSGRSALGTVPYVSFYDLEEQYEYYYRYVKRSVGEDHIKRPNIGSILELLTRYYFQEMTGMYPKYSYTITGGLSYSRGSSTLGELDILIYDNNNCKVEIIGESKASSPSYQRRSLHKAHSQLSRFSDFLDSFF